MYLNLNLKRLFLERIYMVKVVLNNQIEMSLFELRVKDYRDFERINFFEGLGSDSLLFFFLLIFVIFKYNRQGFIIQKEE